jgi:hypothetical protein
MEATGAQTEDDRAEPLRIARVRSPGESSTQRLVAVGDRCSNCDAPLVSDQRYCLACGERRGRAGLAVSPPSSAAPAAAVPPARRSRPAYSSGATLVAGIATLLLAMGVGVLIGHNGNSSVRPVSAAAPQIITVGAGGTAAPTAASAAPRGHARQASHTKASGARPAKVVVTKKVAAAASAAAGKVLGGNSNLAPPTTAVGGSCTHGAGCQGGHFTGNFFGGG